MTRQTVYARDTTFTEDASKIRTGHGPDMVLRSCTIRRLTGRNADYRALRVFPLPFSRSLRIRSRSRV